MDRTKKYTLIFIIGCFLTIGAGGIYQSLIPSPSKDDTSRIAERDNQQEVKEKEETDDEKQSSESGPKKTETQKQTTDSKDKTQKKEPEKKKESHSETAKKKEEADERDYVQITVRGTDSIIASEKIVIETGSTVYDVLKKLTGSKGIELKTSGPSPIIYIKGINGLNEFENGPKSGWKYKVNNVYPSKSSGAYKVEDGDQIEWIYTVDG